MSGWERQLEDGARQALGRPLSGTERTRFAKYMDLLLKWQRVHRLVGSADPNWIVTTLVLDSLLFLRVLPTGAKAVLDLGSGAGFPGIPVAIVRPDLDVTLVEARQRRASFLAAAVRDLPLPNARVRAERAEDARAQLPRSFDAVLVRCAGKLEKVLPLARAFLRPGGIAVASGPPGPKTSSLDVEWVEVAAETGKRRFAVARARAEDVPRGTP